MEHNDRNSDRRLNRHLSKKNDRYSGEYTSEYDDIYADIYDDEYDEIYDLDSDSEYDLECDPEYGPLYDERDESIDVRRSGEFIDGRAHNASNQAGTRESNKKNSNPVTSNHEGKGDIRRRKSRNNPHNSENRHNSDNVSNSIPGHLVHILFVLVIVAVGAVSVMRIIKWNKGKDSDFDPDYINEEYDVEPLDQIFTMKPSRLEGHPDDGVLRILCFGNDAITDGREDDESFCDILAAETGAEVINGGFAGTTIATDHEKYYDNIPNDIYNFYYLANSVIDGDFSILQKNVDALEQGADYTEATVSVLMGVDLNTVDMIVVFYDALDMINYKLATAYATDDYYNITVEGSLGLIFQRLLNEYPHIQVVVLSPYFGYNRNSNGVYTRLSTDDYGNGTLSVYINYMASVCSANSASFIDNFYGTINELNCDDYLTDNIHINADGRRLVVDRFKKAILSK